MTYQVKEAKKVSQDGTVVGGRIILESDGDARDVELYFGYDGKKPGTGSAESLSQFKKRVIGTGGTGGEVLNYLNALNASETTETDL